MASQAKATPDVVGQLLLIEIADIELGERLRPIDMVWAKALGGMMLADGQDEAIKVCRLPGRTNYRLVAGGHRLVGAGLAGMADIKAEVVTNDELARRGIEVRENLLKKGLDPLDRAAFIAELVTIKKIEAGVDPEKDGRSVSAQARWQKVLSDEADDAKDIVSLAYGFNDEVAEELGFSSRTIKRDLFLHRRLLPDVSARLRGHPITRNAGQLKALAKLDEGAQREIAGMLAEGTVKSVAEAVATIKQEKKPTPEEKALSAFIGSFRRMTERDRVGALLTLASTYRADFARFDAQREIQHGSEADDRRVLGASHRPPVDANDPRGPGRSLRPGSSAGRRSAVEGVAAGDKPGGRAGDFRDPAVAPTAHEGSRAAGPAHWIDPATGCKWFRYDDGSYGDELFPAEAVDKFPSWAALQAACAVEAA